MQTWVTKKKGKGGCVQHRYCSDCKTDMAFHWIGPKLGMPPVVQPHHNIRPNNATPQFAELKCPPVCNRQPGCLARPTCTSLRLCARMMAMVLSPLGAAARGKAM